MKPRTYLAVISILLTQWLFAETNEYVFAEEVRKSLWNTAVSTELSVYQTAKSIGSRIEAESTPTSIKEAKDWVNLTDKAKSVFSDVTQKVQNLTLSLVDDSNWPKIRSLSVELAIAHHNLTSLLVNIDLALQDLSYDFLDEEEAADQLGENVDSVLAQLADLETALSEVEIPEEEE